VRRRACTDLCGGRPVKVVPTATVTPKWSSVRIGDHPTRTRNRRQESGWKRGLGNVRVT
jgi:hypothetical protein